MALKIEETFQVQAPAVRVWEFLIDPHRVVECLPGAELVEAEDENTFVGRVKVKVGPVTASYKGKATFVERDDAARRVRMVGEGRETGGAGSAKMTMSSQVVELADGGTEVRVEAELDVVGRIVQFGRGMIEEVNRQLFRQFSECTRARLESADEPTAPAERPEQPPQRNSGEASPGDAVATGTAAAQPAAPARPPAAQRLPAPSQPIRALPLFFKAIWAMIKRFFGRLFGRGGG